jgi:hypothetical protein
MPAVGQRRVNRASPLLKGPCLQPSSTVAALSYRLVNGWVPAENSFALGRFSEQAAVVIRWNIRCWRRIAVGREAPIDCCLIDRTASPCPVG